MPKRETIGKRLKQARDQTGMSVPQLVIRIRDDFGKDVGETTIRDTEKDKTQNPGLKTVESIALGLGLDPLEVIKLGLDGTADIAPGFKASQFARLWKNYSKLKNGQQRAFIDDYVQTLIEKIDRWQQLKAMSVSHR